MEHSKKDLHQKVSDWLAEEGYPLEFRVAHAFRAAGFRVRQGIRIPDSKTGKAREIDVIALKSFKLEEVTFYFASLIECKWSKNKPWVLFSSETDQTHGYSVLFSLSSSFVADVVTHILASDEDLSNDPYLKELQQTTYGGRVAFTKENDMDLFYSTVQSVISKSVLVAKIDDPDILGNSIPEYGSIVFPIIVVNGELFEASYNSGHDCINLEKRGYIRLHWSERGTADHVITIVSFESLGEFIATLSKTAEAILKKSKPIVQQLIQCFKSGTSYPQVPEAERPYTGEPELLAKLRELENAKRKRS